MDTTIFALTMFGVFKLKSSYFYDKCFMYQSHLLVPPHFGDKFCRLASFSCNSSMYGAEVGRDSEFEASLDHTARLCLK